MCSSDLRTGNRVRALDLARQIQQQVVRESHEQAAIERRARELLAELDQPTAGPRSLGLEWLKAERELAAPEAGGVVYPVWFGTNRKPNLTVDGFTAERHDRVTRGRVEVYIPEAHRFGETGTPFWKKLLRFDLRDDTLRVQRVDQQERDAFVSEIHAAMQTARESGETPHALFFLHGFNVTFEEIGRAHV